MTVFWPRLDVGHPTDQVQTIVFRIPSKFLNHDKTCLITKLSACASRILMTSSAPESEGRQTTSKNDRTRGCKVYQFDARKKK